jgi:maltooligosyltrehalose trehalohydrolase
VISASDGVRYRLWAPSTRSVALVIADDGDRAVAMERQTGGWFECVDARSHAGTRYWYEIDKRYRVPDPAARFMPGGPHAASEVVDASTFSWPQGGAAFVRPLRELVFYELHVGTFTPEGTYGAAAERLHELVELGVTAIELMPLAQPSGSRNWGYDGVGLYAPAHAYGLPEELKTFIARAHLLGLCVFLDVVYSHFGPEGNYLGKYAPQFFDTRRKTPWGGAVNYAAPENAAARDYAIENACYWLVEYRFDGLRLDAAPEIAGDDSVAFVRELASRARAAAGRPAFLVAENDRNGATFVHGDLPACDAEWSDVAHHCLHVALTGESKGYYAGYCESAMMQLGRALTGGLPYVNFLQNHDQIGNRVLGERIAMLAPPQAVLAATAVVLLAPWIPLLFMGQEWASSSPFLFFRDLDSDPTAAEHFTSSVLNWSERELAEHRKWLEMHRRLLLVRRQRVAPRIDELRRGHAAFRVHEDRGLSVRWAATSGTLALDANLGSDPCGGFEEEPPGSVLFASPSAKYADGTAPPWSVRWALT